MLAAALLLALGMAPGAAAAPGAAPAPAAVAGPHVTVQLSAITPRVARPGQSVKVTGVVRNTGGKPVAAPVVVARLRTTGLGSRDQVAAWANGSDAVLPGPEVAHQGLHGTLGTGRSASFSLTLPAAAVRSPSAFAALPLAVEVHPGSSPAVVGTTHTFLPWFQRKEFTRLSLAFAIPLTLDPDPDLFGAPSARRTQAWQTAIGPGSRIDRLLTGAGAAPVTWAVDPALLGPPATAEATPANQATSTPSPTPTGSSPATPTVDPVAGLTTALAGRLREGGAQHTIWSLPYSDPDLATTLSLAPGDPSVTTVMATPDQLSAAVGRTVRRDVAWPVDGRISPQREAGLRDLYRGSGLTASIVSASSLPAPDNGVTPDAGRRTPDGLPLLAYDDRLSRLLTATSSPDDGVTTVQQFLADTIAVLQERPSVPRSVLVAAPRAFAGDPDVLAALMSATADAPWLSRTSTTELLHQAVDAETPATQGGAGPAPSGRDALAPGRSPLTRSVLERIPGLRDQIQGVASLVDPAQFRSALWQDAATQLLSSRWRGQPQSFATLRSSVESSAAELSSGIRVNPSNVNFLADQGVLQITVVNTLNVPVHDVRLHLEPGSPRLRIDDQPAPLRINRLSRTTVKVHVTAVAAGLVPVQASLSSANGTRIGQGARVDVRVSPTETWVYWVLGVAAGVVLVLGVFRSLRRGRPRPTLPPQENVLP